MDSVQLRQILGPLIEGLKDVETHDRLGELCERLGLPVPEHTGSKRERMRASFAASADVDLPKVATNLLELHPPSPTVRNLIQELLWADFPAPAIPKKYRREIARSISIEDLFISFQFIANLEIGRSKNCSRSWVRLMLPIDDLHSFLKA
jgi:hypothetical protein